MEEKELLLEQKLHKKNIKKYFGKGIPVFVLRQRVAGTAVMVLDQLKNVSFEDLSLNLYLICGDSTFQSFSHEYEAMLELAMLTQDKFIDGLYAFYDKMGKKIKKEKMLPLFFDFLVFLQEQAIKQNTKSFPVFVAYMDLLLGQTEFLRKDKFAYDEVLVGVTTDGESIDFPDAYPSLDLANYLVEKEVLENKKINSSAALNKLMVKYFTGFGYRVKDYDDTEALRASSRFYQNNINGIAAFINEFTTDIVPTSNQPPRYYEKDWPKPKQAFDFKSYLMQRRRTIPDNGYVVNFTGSKQFDSILIKEVYHTGKIVMLFKATTKMGELSGWYNTKTKVFYGPFPPYAGVGIEANAYLEQIILWAYTSYVCEIPDVKPSTESYLRFVRDNHDVELSFSIIPGKLRPTYGGKGIEKLDTDKYETKVKSIAGYIRKLPVGQNPSEKAVKMAESLGLMLEKNETYVQPFIRSCWVLKEVGE